MNRSSILTTAFLLATALMAVACGGEQAANPSSETSTMLLATDLPHALAVVDAKAKGEGEVVTVVGRVRTYAKGTFTLVDDSLDYCGRGSDTMDGCLTPWDYCCLDQDDVAAKTIVVRAETADGAAVAKSELGVRELDLVAVQGTLQKDAMGSLVLVARQGWHRRERPKLGDSIHFP